MASSGTTSNTMRFTGAQLVVHLLERQGITMVSGIPGGSILPIYDALSQSTQIRHILARHEQGAGFIAQGMARTEGKPAVCMACSGPGATNLVTAIADARLDSIPLVCITGQVPASMIGTDAFQEVDTYGISIPITKHNYLVRDIAELPQVISDAFRIAQSGRPGPVWIDIPKDVQSATIELEALPEPGERAPAPAFAPESVREAAAMINAAKRPVLYLGGGVINAPQAIRELAEKANLPTTMTLMALGMLPKAHPLSLGMLGMHGARSTNYILQEADLLIVMGARFDDRAIGKTEEFCPNAKIIHVDIDRAELGKIKQPHVAIQGDVAEVLAQLIPQTDATDRADWRQLVADLQREFPCTIPQEQDPLTHYGLINAVAACVDDEAIVTTDVGQHQIPHALGISGGESGGDQRAQRMAEQNGFLHPGAVKHPRQCIGVGAGIRPRRRKHRAFAITGHIPGQHAVAGKRHLFMPGGRAGTDAVQQRQRRTASLFTKTRHHPPLATLHFRQRMIFRVGRNMRLWRTEHHAHQRFFLAVVE